MIRLSDVVSTQFLRLFRKSNAEALAMDFPKRSACSLSGRSWRTGVWALLLGGMLALVAGCFSRVETVRPPSFDASGMAAKALAEKDANHDGTLSTDELKDWPGMRSAFKSIDKNSDGKLDANE